MLQLAIQIHRAMMQVVGRTIKMNRVKGFTIVELMITLVVMGAGIGALTYLNTRLANVITFSAAESEAIRLVNSKIDTYRAMNYDSISTATNDTDSVTRGNTSFSRTWSVAAFTNPTYKIVDVMVSWTDVDGEVHTVKAVTAIAKTSQVDLTV